MVSVNGCCLKQRYDRYFELPHSDYFCLRCKLFLVEPILAQQPPELCQTYTIHTLMGFYVDSPHPNCIIKNISNRLFGRSCSITTVPMLMPVLNLPVDIISGISTL